jgi:hypothetical protein
MGSPPYLPLDSRVLSEDQWRSAVLCRKNMFEVEKYSNHCSIVTMWLPARANLLSITKLSLNSVSWCQCFAWSQDTGNHGSFSCAEGSEDPSRGCAGWGIDNIP